MCWWCYLLHMVRMCVASARNAMEQHMQRPPPSNNVLYRLGVKGVLTGCASAAAASCA